MPDEDCLAIYEDADFYDVEFADRNFEIPYYLSFAQESVGPILQVACGTGRLTLPIAAAGHKIAGLDVSKPMLDRAREKSNQLGLDVEWLQQDCRNIKLENRFGLMFIATNSMQHLHQHRAAIDFLRSAAMHIRADGKLLLDVMNPDVQKLTRQPEESYIQKEFNDAEGREVTVEAASNYVADRQVLHFDLTYRVGRQIIKQKSVDFRCFFPEELLTLCEHTGWNVCERFGDYDRSPFTSASPKQLLVLQPHNR